MKSRFIVLCLLLFFSAPVFAQPAVYPIERQSQYPNAATGGNYMFNYYLPPAGTSTPWWPAWSPQGDELAFSLQGSLWRMGIADSVAHEVLHTDTYLSSPAWSPDGQWIVFTSDDGIGINLHMVQLESGEVVALTEGDHLNLDPVWSPDGSRLAYVTTRPSGYFNIEVMTIEEGQPSEVIALTKDNSFGKHRLYFGAHDVHIQPTWSPDGEEIIFLSNRSIPLGSGALWRMPAVAQGIEQAEMIRLEETLYRTRADWSPDGKRLIYSSHLGGQFNNLFVLPAVGGEPYKMTFGEWDNFHPRWSPDGHHIAYISNEKGLPGLKILQTFGGKKEWLPVDEKKWSIDMGHVRVKLVDEQTGEQIAGRIYNKAADGKTYVPDDAYHRLGRMNEHFFHTDGAFMLTVPAGSFMIEAMHGFEYYPEARTVQITANDTLDLTIALHQFADLKADGWYSGSNHVHMNYAGNLHNTPENLVYMAAAEDVGVIGEMICNKDNRILDYQYFTGEEHHLTNDKHVLFFNEEYRPPFYGHVSLINLTEHLISPFVTGYEGTAIESLYPSNTDMFRLARKQGALGAYVHPFWGSRDPLEGNLGNAKAFPVDVALGTVDYHELVSGAGWAAYDVWHQVLNNGFKMPAVGGEDAISSLHQTAIIGQMRAYAYMEGGLSWDGWLDAIRSGALFVTNGPLVRMTVNDKMIGETIQLGADGGEVLVEGIVESIVPLDQIELVVNGRRIPVDTYEKMPSVKGEFKARFSKSVRIQQSSWITLQASNAQAFHPIDDIFPQATTNPIWVMVGDQPVRSAVSAEYFIRWIDKLSDMAAAHPGWRSEAEKTHVLSQFKEAQEVYRDRLREADEMGVK